MTVLRLTLRVLRGGGRAGAVRLVLMLTGVALVVAATLTVAGVPGALQDRARVAGSRFPFITVGTQPAEFRFERVEDSWHGRLLLRILIADVSPTAPAPPGVARMPKAGESIVSPAVSRLLTEDAELASRVPGTVVGTISPDGLLGPDDLMVYSGVTAHELGEAASPASGWFGLTRALNRAATQDANVGLELAVLVVVPALVFLFVAARLSSTTRGRRYAAFRLLGMTRRSIMIVAAAEAGIAGLGGALVGVALHAAAVPAVASSGVVGFTWFPQRSPLSQSLLVAAVGLTAGVAALVGAVGARRAATRPMTVRFDAQEATSRWWLAIPFVLGVAMIVEPLLFDPATGPTGVSERETVVLLVGMLLATAGLLLALRPILAGLAAWLAESALPLTVRIAARRAQCAPVTTLRLLGGLIAVVLVAGTGAGVVRSAELAAGPTVTNRWVTIRGDAVADAQTRSRLYDVPSTSRVASVRSVTDPPGPGEEPRTVEDHIRLGGATLVLATCAEAARLAQSHLSGCEDGRSYRLRFPDAEPGLTEIPSGLELSYGSGDGAVVTVVAPAESLTVTSPPDRLLPGLAILITADQLPTGWSPDVRFDFLIDGADASLQTFLSNVAALAPAAAPEVHQQNLDALEAFRIHKGTLEFGGWIGFLLAVLAFVVAAVDRSVERRRDVALLAVLGMRVRRIRLTQLLQLVAPLVMGLALAALVGNLAANAFLSIDGRQGGWFHGTWRAGLSMVIVALVLGVSASLITVGRRLRTEDLRRE